MKSYHFLFLIACLMVIGVACRPKSSFTVPQTSSVWQVEKDGHIGYLGGTIHLLRSSDFPLPSPFNKAYELSRKVVFELPPDSGTGDKVRSEMFRMGTYASGDDFTKHVSPETYLRVKEWAKKRGVPMERLYPIKPWFIALTVATTEYQALGADPSFGVDHVFGLRAREDKKPSGGLETESQQIAVFSRLDEQMQESFLLQTFDDAENIQEDFEELIGSWRSGDRVRAETYLFKDAEKYEELLELFLYERNRNWMKPITESIQKGEVPYFMVGTAHLFGDRGLLVLLEKAGYKVSQLEP